MPARRSPRHVALQAAELAWAAPRVMAHRLQRLAIAGPRPSTRDRREFSRMGWEKVAAFHESWLAMALETWRVQQALWWSTLGAWWLPATTWRTRRHRPSDAAIGILGHGLAPVHRRALANARRLRGRR
ncbi:MAG TPA: polyhydroxyalkanoate granule-associated phasin [Burkholderiaceae bacterium]|nr:polyhydroxyalkanoate granule-associated phasin [Burkholderiaceae bacterium]